MINAAKELTRKNAESFLEDKHIKKIADAYHGYLEVDDFSRSISQDEIKLKDYSLNISLYVRSELNTIKEDEILDVNESVDEWVDSRGSLHESMNKLINLVR